MCVEGGGKGGRRLVKTLLELRTVTSKESMFCFSRMWCLDLLLPFCGHEGENSHHFIIIIGLLLPGEKGILSFRKFWMRVVFILKKEGECILLLPLTLCPCWVLLLLCPQYSRFWSQSLCSLGRTESHFLGSPLIAHSRLWLFLTISHVYSILCCLSSRNL